MSIKQEAIHICDREGCGKVATTINDQDFNDWCEEHHLQERLRELIRRRDYKRQWVQEAHLNELARMDAEIARMQAEGVKP